MTHRCSKNERAYRLMAVPYSSKRTCSNWLNFILLTIFNPTSRCVLRRGYNAFENQKFVFWLWNFIVFQILNRCNVAIIAKFALKSNPGTNFVVSTTHLLFNPKRHDIRLAQVQVLLAELDRIARDDTLSHVPIILTGDFNVQQTSEVFRLVIGERINPGKLFEKMQFKFNINDKALLPREMGISDHCQHLDVVVNSNRYVTAVRNVLISFNQISFISCKTKN